MLKKAKNKFLMGGVVAAGIIVPTNGIVFPKPAIVRAESLKDIPLLVAPVTPTGFLARASTPAGSGFIGQTTRGNTNGVLSLPASWAAGDLAIVCTVSGSLASLSAGWTSITSFTTSVGVYDIGYWYRVLAGGDTGVTVTYAGSPSCASMCVWRGPTTPTNKFTLDSSTSATPSWTGFTKNASSQFIVSHTEAFANITTETQPTGFTMRQNVCADTSAPYSFGVADISSSGYTNGAAVAWSGYGTGEKSGLLIELT